MDTILYVINNNLSFQSHDSYKFNTLGRHPYCLKTSIWFLKAPIWLNNEAYFVARNVIFRSIKDVAINFDNTVGYAWINDSFT